MINKSDTEIRSWKGGVLENLQKNEGVLGKSLSVQMNGEGVSSGIMENSEGLEMQRNEEGGSMWTEGVMGDWTEYE